MRIVTDYKHAQQIIVELDARIAKLEAEILRTNELHAAILALEGSEGMTDAKFVQWVLLALANSEGENNE